jgi:hypothetical protein
MSALTGPELLAEVKRLESQGIGPNALARETGYFTVKKDGTERINRSAFFEALLEAKGVVIGGIPQSAAGRKLTFHTKVQFNGNLMIGRAYTAAAGFDPGDEFRIVVGRKGFTLKAIAATTFDGSTQDPDDTEDTSPEADHTDGACPMPPGDNDDSVTPDSEPGEP